MLPKSTAAISHGAKQRRRMSIAGDGICASNLSVVKVQTRLSETIKAIAQELIFWDQRMMPPIYNGVEDGECLQTKTSRN